MPFWVRSRIVVIVVPLQPDLGGHAVEAFRALLGASQGQVGDRAGDPPIAVVEGVDGHEPEMRQGGLEHGIDRGRSVEPVEEPRHLRREPVGRRRFVVDPLLADRSGDDLHGACAVVPPGPDPDPVHAAAPGREQGGVPAEQAFLRQRVLVFLGGVEHHLDDAFDMPVGRRQGPDIEPQPACDGGRTWSMSRISPSISLDLRTSWVKVSRTASSRSRKPSPSILPMSRPCR